MVKVTLLVRASRGADMEAYATVGDLEVGWRKLAEDEMARAGELLARASAYLSALLERNGLSENGRADALRIVCCDMVQRKMEAAAIAPVSSVTQQAGSFGQTIAYARPVAKGWKLWPEDLELLGIKNKRAGCMRVAIHDAGGDELDW